LRRLSFKGKVKNYFSILAIIAYKTTVILCKVLVKKAIKLEYFFEGVFILLIKKGCLFATASL